MLNRRLMMAQKKAGPPPGGGIVQEGLVFWLDGMDRGPAGRWVDKIAGADFELLGANELQNGVAFRGASNSYAYADFTPQIFGTDGTIEITALRTNANNSVIFSPNSKNDPEQFSVGPYGGGLIWSNGNIPPRKIYLAKLPTSKNFTISITDEHFCLNKSFSSATSGSDLWGGSTAKVITLAGRSDGRNGGARNAFAGTIYSVRMYNRKLTDEEILQNQQYDIDTYFGGVIPE